MPSTTYDNVSSNIFSTIENETKEASILSSSPNDPANMHSGISEDILSISNLNPFARTFYPRMLQGVTYNSSEKSRTSNVTLNSHANLFSQRQALISKICMCCPKSKALGFISNPTESGEIERGLLSNSPPPWKNELPLCIRPALVKGSTNSTLNPCANIYAPNMNMPPGSSSFDEVSEDTMISTIIANTAINYFNIIEKSVTLNTNAEPFVPRTNISWNNIETRLPLDTSSECTVLDQTPDNDNPLTPILSDQSDKDDSNIIFPFSDIYEPNNEKTTILKSNLNPEARIFDLEKVSPILNPVINPRLEDEPCVHDLSTPLISMCNSILDITNSEFGKMHDHILETGNVLSSESSETHDPKKILCDLKHKNADRPIIGQLNINSIASKFEPLVSLFKDNVDLLMVSETKVDNTFPLEQFKIEGYSRPIRLDRNRNGGGVMVFPRIDLPCHELKSHKIPIDLECTFLELRIRQSKWLVVAGYNPHKNKISYFLENISKALDIYLPKYENLLLIGDWNSAVTENEIK